MEATIRRAGNLILIKPSFPFLISKLTYMKREVSKNKQGYVDTKHAKYVKIQCYKEQDGGIVTPAGFTARVCHVLRENGVTLKFTDCRERKLPEPEFERLDPLDDGQEKALAAIVAHDNGIIEGPCGMGKSWLIKQLCKIWPKSKLIISSYSTDIVRQIYTDLLEMFPFHEVGMVGGGEHRKCRITCAVDKSLEHADLDGCDLFIYDEVHRAGAAETKKLIGRVRNAKMIGFSASPKGRCDNTDMEVEALFGPIIHRQSYLDVQQTGRIVPISAYIFDTSNCANREYQKTVAMERNLIWKSDDRNEIVAKAVRWAIEEFNDPQILVTVKTVTHAAYLKKYLPEFELVYATMNRDDRDEWARMGLIDSTKHPITFKQRKELYDGFRAGTIKRAIATGVWSTGVDFPGLNVLVRADAQASPIANTQLPGRVSRAKAGKETGVLIDFNDRFNETLHNRYYKRTSIYRKKGWDIILT